MIIAIIPARGGSKRLPRKNILPFAGHPLIAYSIAAANKSRYINRCIVSTDNSEIAKIALAYGAEVLDRPAHLASDRAKTGQVMQHAIGAIKHVGEQINAVVLLQPTNVLRSPEMIDRSIELFLERDVDSVITVTESHSKTGRIVNGIFQPNYVPETRSQDLEPLYFENGQVYVSQPQLVAGGEIFGSRILPYITDPLFASDIDTELDFQLAEFLYFSYRDKFISIGG